MAIIDNLKENLEKQGKILAGERAGTQTVEHNGKTYAYFARNKSEYIEHEGENLSDVITGVNSEMKTIQRKFNDGSPILKYVNPVNGSDSNDGSSKEKSFKTIKKAISSLPRTSQTNCVINLSAGVYKETVQIYGRNMPCLQLIGEGKEVTIIEGQVDFRGIGGSVNITKLSVKTDMDRAIVFTGMYFYLGEVDIIGNPPTEGVAMRGVTAYGCNGWLNWVNIYNKKQAINSYEGSTLVCSNCGGEGNSPYYHANGSHIKLDKNLATYPENTRIATYNTGGTIESVADRGIVLWTGSAYLLDDEISLLAPDSHFKYIEFYGKAYNSEHLISRASYSNVYILRGSNLPDHDGTTEEFNRSIGFSEIRLNHLDINTLKIEANTLWNWKGDIAIQPNATHLTTGNLEITKIVGVL